MTALNRFYWPTKFESRINFLAERVKCIFISYQRTDYNNAKKIADYLIESGISVYFDEYDKDLKLQSQDKASNHVTDALCKGINNSSHMLVVVSPSTVFSQWVPFEIGYGYDKTDLSVLCLKGIPIGSLPEYIRVANVIRDIYDLNEKLSNVKNTKRELLLESTNIKAFNSRHHSLSNVMDDIIIESY